MSEVVLKEKFYVGYSDVNRDFELSNVAVLKHFQNLTTIQGAIANDSLRTTNSAWFLTAYHVKFFKRPEYENWANYITWSRTFRGVTASREFEIRDDNDNLMMCALANYARVNKVTQKIERIPAEFLDIYGESDRSSFDSPWVAKLQESDHYDYVKEYVMDRNFIDLNNHVNNVAYLEIASLVVPDEVYNQKESLEFEVMYKKAIKYKEKVKCYYKEESDYYNIVMKSEDDSNLFAIVKLYKNKD